MTERATGVLNRAYKVLAQSPGIPMHFQDVATATGDNPSSVATAFNRMHHNSDYPVFRVSKGTVVFRPNTEYPTAAYAVEVTPTKEMDVVSPYPPEVTKVKVNSEYGKSNLPVFEYVGSISDKKILIRSTEDQIYVAIPLSEFVD